jgi:hypothetical protein
MKKSNAKTSLKITMNPEGGSSINLKWDDRDCENKNGHKASERIMNELIKIPDYEWLAPLVAKYFDEKYCNKCVHHPFDENDMLDCGLAQKSLPFPYCFSENNSKEK